MKYYIPNYCTENSWMKKKKGKKKEKEKENEKNTKHFNLKCTISNLSSPIECFDICWQHRKNLHIKKKY